MTGPDHSAPQRWLRLLTAACLLLCCIAAPAQSTPFKHQWLTVVMDDNYPPYSFRDAQGKLQGIRKDMWDLWAAETGVEVRIVATDWPKVLAYVNTGQADVVDTIFRTEAREQIFDYSRPYADIDVPIYFHRSISGITNAASLRGFTVGAKERDACIDWLKARGIDNFRTYPSYDSLVDAATRSDIRIFCIDQPQASYLLNKRNIASEFRHSPPLYTGQLHWAVPKGNTAAYQLIKQGFARIPAEKIEAVDETWLGAPLNSPSVRLAPYIVYMLLAVGALALAMSLWNWSLRRRVASRTTELVSTLQALKSSEQHYQTLVSTSPVGVYESDVHGRYLYVNDRGLQMLGIRQEQLLGEGWKNVLHPDDREAACAAWEATTRQQIAFQQEFRFMRSNGSSLWVLVQAAPIRNAENIVTRYIGTFTDISLHKESEERIEFLAYHDPLTGLPNRLLIRDHFDMAVAHADRGGSTVALLVLDLDHFKTINDTLGHPVGDALLCAVADQLRNCVRETDTISRQGGDEFLLLLTDLRHAEEAANIAAKILGYLSRPIALEQHELSISLSIGIGMYPNDGHDFDTLLKKADTAMYHAKESGRSAFHFFTEQMNADAIQTLLLRSNLARALERKEFVLHYQPQVDLNSGAIIGAEALIRWRHPELGLVPPNHFIPIAENSGLIVPIGEWVLQEACRQAIAWQEAGLPPLTMAVNLSAIQFKRGDLEGTVSAALADAGLDPAWLELELTESILIQETENVLNIVRKLKTLGVKLSIDDFGTGYSSLTYLRRLDVDKLKIDQSFVRDLDRDPDDAAIVRAVIQMARSLNLRTIAEGVENRHLLDILRLLHCDEAQGYHLGHPMPADDFARHVTAGKQASTV